MKNIAIVFAFLITSFRGLGQNPDQQFTPTQLKDDLAYLKHQLYNVHINPFTELTKTQYDNLFNDIDTRITTPMTALQFYKLIKPAVAYLSDEHAQISINPNLTPNDYKEGNVFLPFNLSRKGNSYVIDEVLNTDTVLKKGDVIKLVDNKPVGDLLIKCAQYTTGFPEQRAQKAMDQFGYLYAIANPVTSAFMVTMDGGKTRTINGTRLKQWQNYVLARAGQSGKTDKRITYTAYGEAGYLNVPEFNARTNKDMDSLKAVFTKIFGQVKSEGVKYLFIDVSKNSGGNSQVGDVLTGFFYDKPYRGYQCNWKRSDEYLSLIKSWGFTDANYAAQPVGKVIHFDSGNTVPTANPVRFKGKVYVLVGDGTFSSAIMFATVIKDNHIAPLIGKTPADGHPNHFGELYTTNLPNTKLDVRFGVKEWIRPNGKGEENVLYPDKLVNVNQPPIEIIKTTLRDFALK
jgi:C-terminal processing protease CtpA/Prc